MLCDDWSTRYSAMESSRDSRRDGLKCRGSLRGRGFSILLSVSTIFLVIIHIGTWVKHIVAGRPRLRKIIRRVDFNTVNYQVSHQTPASSYNDHLPRIDVVKPIIVASSRAHRLLPPNP